MVVKKLRSSDSAAHCGKMVRSERWCHVVSVSLTGTITKRILVIMIRITVVRKSFICFNV